MVPYRSTCLPDTFPHAGLGGENIDIWLAHYRHMTNPSLLNRMRSILSAAECDKEQRFYFADDRQRFLVTRALTRVVLSRYGDMSPAGWTFSENDFGRPAVSNPEGSLSQWCFNISHTDGLIALAVARGQVVGIDIESRTVRPAPLEIADHFFAPPEVADLTALAPRLRHDRFFEYWTLKEAYIKARGIGLSLSLQLFHFAFPDARTLQLTIDPRLGDRAERWNFWQMRPTASHVMALCAARRGDACPSVSVRTVVPGTGGAIFDEIA